MVSKINFSIVLLDEQLVCQHGKLNNVLHLVKIGLYHLPSFFSVHLLNGFVTSVPVCNWLCDVFLNSTLLNHNGLDFLKNGMKVT